eukprot:10178486-Lingulodinium_polyedra.AAC.1
MGEAILEASGLVQEHKDRARPALGTPQETRHPPAEQKRCNKRRGTIGENNGGLRGGNLVCPNISPVHT